MSCGGIAEDCSRLRITLGIDRRYPEGGVELSYVVSILNLERTAPRRPFENTYARWVVDPVQRSVRPPRTAVSLR